MQSPDIVENLGLKKSR